jgi:hypothetical protein
MDSISFIIKSMFVRKLFQSCEFDRPRCDRKNQVSLERTVIVLCKSNVNLTRI